MNSKLIPNGEHESMRLIASRKIESANTYAAPKSLAYLPFQNAGIDFMHFTPRMLNADPPGVGKTIQSIGFMNAKRIKKALIIAPASLLLNWKSELQKWHILAPKIEIFSSKKFKPQEDHEIVLMSYSFVGSIEACKKIIAWGDYEICIFDECHNLKNSKAKRTKYALAKNGLHSKAKFVHALSGTPFMNRPMEIFPIIQAICPKAIGGMNYFEFGLQFCNGFKGDWGWDFTGASDQKLLGQVLRSHVMLRRKKSLVLPQLPARYTPSLIFIDPTNKARAVIDSVKTFDADAIAKNTVKAEFTEMSAYRAEIGNEKIIPAADYISTQLEAGHEKIVVFAHHTAVIEGLRDILNLKYPTLILTGKQNAKDKNDAVNNFQNDRSIKVIIVSIDAGGVGITLTKASYAIFVECSWVPGANEQAIDRLHRIGQEHGVMTDYLVHEGSLDERILKLNWRKQKIFDEVFQ